MACPPPHPIRDKSEIICPIEKEKKEKKDSLIQNCENDESIHCLFGL
jgi:hypothetical protein